MALWASGLAAGFILMPMSTDSLPGLEGQRRVSSFHPFVGQSATFTLRSFCLFLNDYSDVRAFMESQACAGKQCFYQPIFTKGGFSRIIVLVRET